MKLGGLMDLSEYSFFNPSPNFREMSILKALTESSSVSQERLARLAGIVPSMVNKYIKDFEDSGLIQKEGENRRNMKYVLTEAGKFRLQYLTILYLKEAAKLYTESREIFGEVLDVLKESEHESFYLYGAGIIGGSLADILRTEGMRIIGFLDDSPAKQNGTFHDLHVFSPDEAECKDETAVIVASFRHADNIVKNARENGMKNVMVFTISRTGKVELEQVD